MTHDECERAVSQYPREAVLLALVAQMHEPVLKHCWVEIETACEWVLDVSRRWALGLAEEGECHAAGEAAAVAANLHICGHAVWNLSVARAIITHAFYAVACAGFAARKRVDDGGAVERAELVDALRDAPRDWGDVVITAHGDVVTAESVWLRDGYFGGRWIRREALTSEEAVLLDQRLEAA